MGFVLSIIAYILFFLTAILNFPIVMITHVKKHGFLNVMNEYWFNNARDLDIYGNYTYRTTWNLIFKRDYGYSFGKHGETISSALGKNQLKGTLSIGGWVAVLILWSIDYQYWRKGGHCINSIQKI